MEDVNGRPVSQKTLDPSRKLMTDILQDTKQYLAESIRALADFRHGRVHGNVTREEVIEILKDCIAHYEKTLHRYGADKIASF